MASLKSLVKTCEEQSCNSNNTSKEPCHEKETGEIISNSKSNPERKHFCSERSMFYKKPISKNNYKLEVDFDDTPQEIRRQQLLEHQKK